MMKKKYILALFTLCMTGGAYSQTLSQAKNWFLEGKFAEAKPVFKKLVKQSPSNASYNFWYGACCYETGEKEEAQPYLEKSAARKVINAYLYLGKLYYDQYRFDEAVENIENHIYWLEQKKKDTTVAEKELDRCRHAARMLRGTENIVVIDSFAVDKQDFLSAYKLSKESGTINMNANGTGTEFTNEMGDKKIVTQTDAEGYTYLASQIRMIDQWSQAEPIYSLNQNGQNLNYPFMASDGITLYYASEGEESMGGYDIFVTRYDSESNTYLKPDNIGMPFNSPYNDYMYALDDFNNLGWFASDRYQPDGKVCIYVFMPNTSKTVYDYETTDKVQIINAATLKCIRSTWNNEDKLRTGRQQLAKVLYSNTQTKQKSETSFVIDDHIVYNGVSDFVSKEAGKLYQAFLQKQKDLETMEMNLHKLRSSYHQSNKDGKNNLTPQIQDQEKRVKELRSEIDALITSIRNTELKNRN